MSRLPLKFLVCGSEGSGKSTLIDRLGATSGTERKWVAIEVAEAPASLLGFAVEGLKADAVIIFADAAHEIDYPIRHLAQLARLLGVRHLILAVVRLVVVNHSEATFAGLVQTYSEDIERLGFDSVHFIPVAVKQGNDIDAASWKPSWFSGPSLSECLEELCRISPASAGARTLGEGGDGQIAGTVRRGELPASAFARKPVEQAAEEDVDLSPEDLLSELGNPADLSDQFCAHILWTDADHLLPGRGYTIRHPMNEVVGTVTRIKYRLDIESGRRLPAETVGQNDVAVANLSLNEPIAFDSFVQSRQMGGFTVHDRETGKVLGVGMIDFALRRTSNLRWQKIDVTKASRALLKGQQPAVLWFTGLSAAGKSTIANIVEKKLFAAGFHTYLLDGDNLRHGINRDLGFTQADRVENIRRVAEIARLMTDAGLIVLTSFISPFRAERQAARELFSAGEFVEIFVDVPLSVAEARDPKGLYRRARSGQLANFTGIDSPYEAPNDAEMVLQASLHTAEELAEQVLGYLGAKGYAGKTNG